MVCLPGLFFILGAELRGVQVVVSFGCVRGMVGVGLRRRLRLRPKVDYPCHCAWSKYRPCSV